MTSVAPLVGAASVERLAPGAHFGRPPRGGLLGRSPATAAASAGRDQRRVLPANRRRAARPVARLAARRLRKRSEVAETPALAPTPTRPRRMRRAATRRSISMRTGQRDTSDIARTSDGSRLTDPSMRSSSRRRPTVVSVRRDLRDDGLVAPARAEDAPRPAAPQPTPRTPASVRRNGRSRSSARRSSARRARCSTFARATRAPAWRAATAASGWPRRRTPSRRSSSRRTRSGAGARRATCAACARSSTTRSSSTEWTRPQSSSIPGRHRLRLERAGRRRRGPGRRHPRGREGPRHRRLLARRGHGRRPRGPSRPSFFVAGAVGSSPPGVGHVLRGLRACPSATISTRRASPPRRARSRRSTSRANPDAAWATWRSAGASCSSLAPWSSISRDPRPRRTPETGASAWIDVGSRRLVAGARGAL